jgi:predicted dehydrogenase/threonine dehydrogenase-like Zn-dependent dehydrogenase
MLQVVQSLGTGTTEVLEVPDPVLRPGTLLIATAASLVSAGTERMLVEFGRSNLLEKARQQPEKVRMVLERVRTDGLSTTLEAVRSKLDQPIAVGYCNVGRVIGVGAGVQGFAVGDVVVSNGPHAEIVRVPANLCARVPEGVDGQSAAFAVAASIALQGIRLAAPTIGETFAVIGLGLLGQLAVQLLRANGCTVLGIDLDEARLRLAATSGATVAGADTDPVGFAMSATRGRGVDGVIVTAATPSNEPIRNAATMSRKRGRLVLVGVTGLDLLRSDFYEKELSFQVSCSYGPGRYDPEYEEKGNDYPFGLVRWTAQRNFEACLGLLATAQLQVAPLITHRFQIAEAARAYDLLLQDRSALGIVLQYDCSATAARAASNPVRSVRMSRTDTVAPTTDRPVVALVGAGNYASRVLAPALADAQVDLHTLVNTGSVLGSHSARKFGFRFASTDLDSVLDGDDVDTIVIATRHDSHGRLVARALQAGKNVFVEKPLALTMEEVQQIAAVVHERESAGGDARLMVGFNRRFAPTVAQLQRAIQARGSPPAFIYTVNAGAVPAGHWTLDAGSGGGRLIGEACHFVDLLRYLAAAPIAECCVYALDRDDVQGTFSIGLRFVNGAMGTVHYLANGHPGFPKERLEVFCGGSILQLDNFRRLRGFGTSAPRGWALRSQDKGHRHCVRAFVDSIRRGTPMPIPAGEILEVSRAVVELGTAWLARDSQWLRIC